jgi:hypothetical protein
MAYSGFKLKELKRQFNLEEQGLNLFQAISPIKISDWLQETLRQGLKMPLLSEKARSERIISPLLFELWRYNNESFGIYSGYNLEADNEQGLNGECDFILAARGDTYTLESPVFILIEAKDSDIKQGIAQCIAQMLGAHVYNQHDGNTVEQIYGCVTTGEDWQFLKLEANIIYIDTQRYYLNNIPKILGILQAILENYHFSNAIDDNNGIKRC